jgi:superoxide oxidase
VHKLLNTTARYGWVFMGLHWLMLLLLVAVVTCIVLSDSFPKDSETRALLKTWHFMLGLTVFTLVWFRLVAKLASPAPLIVPPIAHWQDMAAKAVQALLYLLMIAMPLLGWLMLSAAGKPIPFFGLQLPPLIAENKDIVETIKEIHEAGAIGIYVLVGIHAVAALYHHYFVRDNTLRRMLP